MHVTLGILRLMPSFAYGKVFEHHVSAPSVPFKEIEQN